MNQKPFRIGTRGSKLALVQANLISSLLEKNGIKTEIKIIKTSGDTFTDRPLYQVLGMGNGVGAFVREIDDKMLANEIDIAVHSMKDIPTERPYELSTAAVLKRDSPHDFLLTQNGIKLKDMPSGSVIGTTSLRRMAQILRIRPDLIVKDLRGNIDTRIRKLNEGMYDGILLAEAGLERMKWTLKGERLSLDDFIPSANQGTIVVVTKKGTDAEKAVSILDDKNTRIETRIERIIIGIVGGGCLVPVGAYAKIEKDKLHVRAEILSPDGKRQVKIDELINPTDYEKDSERLGYELLKKGAKELVDESVELYSEKRGNNGKR